MIRDVETSWSRELGADVSITPTTNGEYTLYVDHHYELTATMPSVEDYLHRLAFFTDTGYNQDTRDGF